MEINLSNKWTNDVKRKLWDYLASEESFAPYWICINYTVKDSSLVFVHNYLRRNVDYPEINKSTSVVRNSKLNF